MKAQSKETATEGAKEVQINEVERLKAQVKELSERLKSEPKTLVERIQYFKTKDEQIKRLNDLGFVWDPRNDQWEHGFSYLVKYKQREGHCKVPSGYKDPDGYHLGSWAGKQLQQKDQLSEEKISRLNAIGFFSFS